MIVCGIPAFFLLIIISMVHQVHNVSSSFFNHMYPKKTKTFPKKGEIGKPMHFRLYMLISHRGEKKLKCHHIIICRRLIIKLLHQINHHSICEQYPIIIIIIIQSYVPQKDTNFKKKRGDRETHAFPTLHVNFPQGLEKRFISSILCYLSSNFYIKLIIISFVNKTQ